MVEKTKINNAGPESRGHVVGDAMPTGHFEKALTASHLSAALATAKPQVTPTAPRQTVAEGLTSKHLDKAVIDVKSIGTPQHHN